MATFKEENQPLLASKIKTISRRVRAQDKTSYPKTPGLFLRRAQALIAP